MRVLASKRNMRSLSPGELKELYGLTMREIYSAESNFMKESYNRDKVQLQNHLNAITTEQNTKLREMDHQKQRFMRDHKKILRRPKNHVTYHKVFTVNERPESTVPPCIPFSGSFPPSRHTHSVQSVCSIRTDRVLSRCTDTSVYWNGTDAGDDICSISGHGPVSSHAKTPTSPDRLTCSRASQENVPRHRRRRSVRPSRKDNMVIRARPQNTSRYHRDSRPATSSPAEDDTVTTAASQHDASDARKKHHASRSAGQARVNKGGKAPPSRQNSGEMIPRQDTPSRGSDSTGSLDDEELLQELQEYAQRVLAPSQRSRHNERPKLFQATSVQDSTGIPDPPSPPPVSQCWSAGPRFRADERITSPDAKATPPEDKGLTSGEVQELVDRWLEQINTAPGALNKSEIRSKWQQLCQGIADLQNPSPNSVGNTGGQQGKHNDTQTDGDQKKAVCPEAREGSKDLAVTATGASSNTNTPSGGVTRPVTGTQLMGSSAHHFSGVGERSDSQHSGSMSFLSSLLSGPRALSSTFPPSRRMSNASHPLSGHAGQDNGRQSMQDPEAGNPPDTQDSVHIGRGGSARGGHQVSASSTSLMDHQTPFRSRANTTGATLERPPPPRQRASTALERPRLSMVAGPGGRRAVTASSRSATARQDGHLQLLHPPDRRASSDSAYSVSDDDIASSSPYRPGVSRDEKKRVVSAARAPHYSHTTITRLPDSRGKTSSYTTGPQASDHVIRAQTLNTAQGTQKKTMATSTSAHNHSASPALPSVVQSPVVNMTVPEIKLPDEPDTDDMAPDRSSDIRRVSFSNVSSVRSASSQNPDKDAGNTHHDPQRQNSDQGGRSFMDVWPNSVEPSTTGNNFKSDTAALHQQRCKTAMLSASYSYDQRRHSYNTSTRSVSSAPQRRSSSAHPETEVKTCPTDSSKMSQVQDLPARQEVVLHTDPQGRQHKLTVRTVNLGSPSSREANVTILHEDKTLADDIDPSHHDQEGGEQDPSSQLGPDDTPLSGRSSSRKSNSTNSGPNSVEDEADAEKVALWRRRLSRRNRSSWIPEFAEDKDAQALALAILAERRKSGLEADRFKAVVHALAAANHLLQKRRQETLTVLEELKFCRYLRMPLEHMAEELRELRWDEVFAK